MSARGGVFRSRFIAPPPIQAPALAALTLLPVIYGAATIADDAETVAGAAGVALAGAGAVTDDTETIASLGYLPLFGEGTAGDSAGEVVAGDGDSAISAAGTITDDIETVAGTGAITLTGAGAVMDIPETLAGLAGLDIIGAGAITDSVDAVVAGSVLLVGGDGVIIDGGEVVTGSGEIIRRPFPAPPAVTVPVLLDDGSPGERITIAGDEITASALIWRRFHRPMPGLAERVYSINPGLAKLGVHIPIGTAVVIPIPNPAPVRTAAPIRLWG